MEIFNIKGVEKKIILSLGSESSGNFSVYQKGKLYFSDSFGDLLVEKNFNQYKQVLRAFFKKNKIKPNVILTDLHPLYKTTVLGQKLSENTKTERIQIQHHMAHIFSAVGDEIIQNQKFKIRDCFLGIALDGTGYGLDGNIWGGEIFRFSKVKNQDYSLKIERIGHLENQTLIGGDLSVLEPARMLISILTKISNHQSQVANKSKIKNQKLQKDFVYRFVKKHYSRNEFETLYNQLQQNFNCVETSSTGRVLDAVSVLLGFAKNNRKYKHEPVDLLEENSTRPYALEPVIVFDKKEKQYILQTTPLFNYLIINLGRDKKRLAATAQFYIARGLYKIIQSSRIKVQNSKIYLAGGIADNKIISSFLMSAGVCISKKIPRSDAGLSFGQIIFYLSTNSRN